jgi:hypothetical protein
MSELHVILFGDLSGELWGAGVGAGAGALVVGDRDGEQATIDLPAGSWRAEQAGWHLHGDGVDLHVVSRAEGTAADGEAGDGASIGGFQELSSIRGTLWLGGRVREVDCLGTRAEVDGIDAGALSSIRAVAGWTGPDEAFTLLALRAPGAAGHEADLVAATIFDADGWIPVSDPRLSTTYDGEGHPTRVTLELWVGDEEHEYPRRAAGEAGATRVVAAIRHPDAAGELGNAQLEVLPLRSHSRGSDGHGVYALLTVG